MFSTLAKVFSPAFYARSFQNVVASTRKDFQAGSAAPLFKAMILVGVIGYSIEYTQAGRYHVMERQAIIKKAMEGHHH